MARYENEHKPLPVDDLPSGDSPYISGGYSGGGSSAGSSAADEISGGGNPYSNRKIGDPMIEKERFRHKGYGTEEKGVQRGKTKTDNRGLGAIRRSTAPREMLSLVLFEPEALMKGRDSRIPLSHGRFALRDELSSVGVKWCEDKTTGVTAAMNLSEEQVKELSLKYDLRSALFIEVDEQWTSFHSQQLSFRDGKARKGHERRVRNISPGELFDTISSTLLTRLPDLEPLGIKDSEEL